MSVLVKICGVRDETTLQVAIDAGADFVGFVLVEASPRSVPWLAAKRLAMQTSPHARPVFLIAGLPPPPGVLGGLVSFMSLQLHGAETAEAIAELRGRTTGPVIKALGVQTAADLKAAAAYALSADMLLLDAKPPKGADRTGGHGSAFDWSVLDGWMPPPPAAEPRLDGPRWMLAGGLTPDTVADAIRVTSAPAVDVSTGVESAPGVKDPVKIRDFIQAAKGA